jgi:2-polyprenyl-3-methyl-5-hydroxy-6-metoxy-1,4-benzoquinol methylase
MDPAALAPFEQSYWTEDSQYRKFDDYATALAALRRWYQGFFRLIAPEMPARGRAVDGGCGHGAVVHEFLARGWDAYGFDTSSWIIERAQRHAPGRAGRFAVGELSSVPFDGDFDLVTCLEVLEHVKDPAAALASLSGRLRPGGRLIATTPNLRPLIPWWDPVSADPTHVSVHEPGWWRGALEHAGMAVVGARTYLAIPLAWRVHGTLARWIPLGARVGPGIAIVGERR